MNVYIHSFKGGAGESAESIFDHLPDEVRAAFPNGVAGNMIGFLENVHWDPEYQSDRQKMQDIKGAIIADLQVIDERMRGVFKNLHEIGRLDKIGFSVDVEGMVVEGPILHGIPTKDVESITKGYALDCVTYPAAGGIVLSVKASDSNTDGDPVKNKNLKEATRIGTFIRNTREKLEMETTQLARAIGVEPDTLLAIEDGSIERPPDARLRRIARALKVSLDSLIKLLPQNKREEESMNKLIAKFLEQYAPSLAESVKADGVEDVKVLEALGKAVEACIAALPDLKFVKEAGDEINTFLNQALEAVKSGDREATQKAIEAALAYMAMAKKEEPAPPPAAAEASAAAAAAETAAKEAEAKEAEAKAKVEAAKEADEKAKAEAEAAKATVAKEAAVRESASQKRMDVLEAGLKKSQISESKAVLNAKLSESGLPMASRERIAKELIDRILTEANMENRINDEKDFIAALSEKGDIVGMGLPAAQRGTAVGMTEADRLEKMVDLLVDPDLATLKETKDNYKGVEPFLGLREAWTHITGDRHVRFDRRALSPRMIEAVTSDFPRLFGDSITRHLLRLYRTYPQQWRNVVTIRSLNDFRTQRPQRWGTFDDLAVVAENAVFTDFNNPTETETTYTPSKRGKKFAITREMILQDDLRRLRQIGPSMSRAANRTLEKFVWTLVIGNSGGGGINSDLVSDGTAIYTVGHANLAADALDADSLRAARIRIMLQTDEDSNETLGIMKPWLVVPVQEGPNAEVLVKSEQLPGSANNDRNDNFNSVDILIVPYLEDTNNFYLVAKPADQEGIELGFVEGEQEPQVLIQDDPRTGDVFTNERVTMKVRHEYGGAVTTFQSFDGSIVP